MGESEVARNSVAYIQQFHTWLHFCDRDVHLNDRAIKLSNQYHAQVPQTRIDIIQLQCWAIMRKHLITFNYWCETEWEINPEYWRKFHISAPSDVNHVGISAEQKVNIDFGVCTGRQTATDIWRISPRMEHAYWNVKDSAISVNMEKLYVVGDL